MGSRNTCDIWNVSEAFQRRRNKQVIPDREIGSDISQVLEIEAIEKAGCAQAGELYDQESTGVYDLRPGG